MFINAVYSYFYMISINPMTKIHCAIRCHLHIDIENLASELLLFIEHSLHY